MKRDTDHKAFLSVHITVERTILQSVNLANVLLYVLCMESTVILRSGASGRAPQHLHKDYSDATWRIYDTIDVCDIFKCDFIHNISKNEYK